MSTCMIARSDMPIHYIRMQETTDYRAQFPILETGLYFNHAAVGPWPRCTADAVTAFADENCRQGSAGYISWIRRENDLRSALARLISARGDDDIALLKNTTEGICTVAYGLDWKPGDRVVMPAGEFPSNDLPWRAQQAHGVEIDTVDIRQPQDAEQALIDALTPATRLLTVSAVQWNDGFRLDLERLGNACRERNVLFFVDAIQQLGVLPIDVEACRIDALAADAHKWLLGPEGIAVFYCRDSLREQLTLQQRGWHMFDNPFNFRRTDWTPSSSARRFEAGSPNTLGQVGLHASLELMERVGFDEIAKRVLRNTGHLVEEMGQRSGLEIRSSTASLRRSGIVTFRPVGGSAIALHKALQAEGVSCVLREDGIRLSPHFYQGENEIGRFVELLDEVIR